MSSCIVGCLFSLALFVERCLLCVACLVVIAVDCRGLMRVVCCLSCCCVLLLVDVCCCGFDVVENCMLCVVC